MKGCVKGDRERERRKRREGAIDVYGAALVGFHCSNCDTSWNMAAAVGGGKYKKKNVFESEVNLIFSSPL